MYAMKRRNKLMAKLGLVECNTLALSVMFALRTALQLSAVAASIQQYDLICSALDMNPALLTLAPA